jgi:hypothetical protein
VDGVESVQRERQGVGPVELEGVVRLGCDVDPHHLEAGPVVADRGPTGPTEEVD